MIPDVLVYPIAVLWAAGLFLAAFRRGIFWGWKVGALLLLAFFAVWFREPLMAGHTAFRYHFAGTVISMFSALWHEAGRSLHLLWPLAVFVAFFGASDRSSTGILRAMVIGTVFFWLLFFLFRSLPPGWEHHIESRLPAEIKMPNLPLPSASPDGQRPPVRP